MCPCPHVLFFSHFEKAPLHPAGGQAICFITTTLPERLTVWWTLPFIYIIDHYHVLCLWNRALSLGERRTMTLWLSKGHSLLWAKSRRSTPHSTLSCWYSAVADTAECTVYPEDSREREFNHKTVKGISRHSFMDKAYIHGYICYTTITA